MWREHEKQNLSVEELGQFLQFTRPLVFPKDHIIFANGDHPDYVYYIESGSFRIFRLGREGQQVTLSVRYAGELIGLAEALLDTPRECFAETMEVSCVQAIMIEDFQELMQKDASFATTISKIVSQRLRQTEEHCYELAIYTVTGRLASFLRTLAWQCGQPHKDGILLNIRLTHQDFANCIGTTRQSVTQILSTLKEEGIIKMQNKQIIIGDLQKLEQYIF